MALRLLTLTLPSLMALAMAAPAGAANTQGAAPDAAANGQKLFATTCGFCHANGGRKAGKGPKLAGSKRSDEFLMHRIKNGKKGRMPAFGRTFSDAQIGEIVAYIRSLEP